MNTAPPEEAKGMLGYLFKVDDAHQFNINALEESLKTINRLLSSQSQFEPEAIRFLEDQKETIQDQIELGHRQISESAEFKTLVERFVRLERLGLKAPLERGAVVPQALTSAFEDAARSIGRIHLHAKRSDPGVRVKIGLPTYDTILNKGKSALETFFKRLKK